MMIESPTTGLMITPAERIAELEETNEAVAMVTSVIREENARLRAAMTYVADNLAGNRDYIEGVEDLRKALEGEK